MCMFDIVLVISKYPQAFFSLGCVQYALPFSVYSPLHHFYTIMLLHLLYRILLLLPSLLYMYHTKRR
jgi:hypothetical protein